MAFDCFSFHGSPVLLHCTTFQRSLACYLSYTLDPDAQSSRENFRLETGRAGGFAIDLHIHCFLTLYMYGTRTIKSNLRQRSVFTLLDYWQQLQSAQERSIVDSA